MDKKTKDNLLFAGQVVGAGYLLKKMGGWTADDATGLGEEMRDFLGDELAGVLHVVTVICCTITWTWAVVSGAGVGFIGTIVVGIIALFILARFGLACVGWLFCWICLSFLVLLIAPFTESVSASDFWEGIRLAVTPYWPWAAPWVK